jgi:hypothetical protein
VVGASTSAPPHAEAVPVATLETRVRLQLTANCLRVPTGRTVLLRLLPHIVRQCSACPDGVGAVVTAGANLRFNTMPRYHNNLRRGRRPRRPLFGLPQTLASEHCTLLCGCVGFPRLPPRFARRDTQLLAARHSAGRGVGWLRQIPVTTRRHLLPAHRAKARPSAALSGFGRTDTYTCSNATRLSPKAASLVPFLPRQERNRPPRRRIAVTRGAASPQLQTPQPRRTAAHTQVKAKQSVKATPIVRHNTEACHKGETKCPP